MTLSYKPFINFSLRQNKQKVPAVAHHRLIQSFKSSLQVMVE